MQKTWREIISAIDGTHPDQFNLDNLKRAAELAGHATPRATLRAQMANYTKVGWAERVEQGLFRLTSHGRAAAGIRPGDRSATPQLG